MSRLTEPRVWDAIGRILDMDQFRDTAPGRLFVYLAERTRKEPEFPAQAYNTTLEQYSTHCLAVARKGAAAVGLSDEELEQYGETARKEKSKTGQRVDGPLLERLEIPDGAWDYVKAKVAPSKFAHLLFGIRIHIAKYYRQDDQEDFKIAIDPKHFHVEVHPRTDSSSPPEEQWPTVGAPDDRAPVTMDEFRDFIVQQSRAQGTTDQERDIKLELWAEIELRRKGLATAEQFFRYLKQHHELRFSEMRAVASAVGVHAIMVDPLLSTPRTPDEDCLVLRVPTVSGDLAPDEAYFGTPPPYVPRSPTDEARKVYGTTGARYAIPNAKLYGTESAFVFLRLEPGASSSQHHHAGDELLMALDGPVSVSFMDSGVTVELRRHSYVHFYSEQNHSVTNNSEQTVHLFIIRFYQFHGRPSERFTTRQEMRAHLWERLRDGNRVGARALEGLTWGWILNVAAEQSILTPREPGTAPGALARQQDQLLNRFGLARFLGQAALRDPSKEAAFLKLAGDPRNRIIAGKAHSYKKLDDWLWHLESNQVKVPKDLLPEIIDLYDVFDLLACEFLFPSSPRQVVVHRPDHDDLQRCPDDWINMVDVLDTLPSLSTAVGPNRGAYRLKENVGGITYEIPTRSLACCDVAISWLRLENSKFETSPNEHAGCEMVVPIEGTVAISYEDDPDNWKPIRAGEHIAHYNSRRRHRIRNVGPEPAAMFVIRFYLDAQASPADEGESHLETDATRRAPIDQREPKMTTRRKQQARPAVTETRTKRSTQEQRTVRERGRPRRRLKR